MPAGHNFQLAKPTVSVNGDNTLLGTDVRQVTEHIYQYVKSPSVSKPATVTITVPAGQVAHYTFGPHYPDHKVDNVSSFKYDGPFTVTNNSDQNGVYLYVVAFEADADGNAEANDQSPVVLAHFKINKS